MSVLSIRGSRRSRTSTLAAVALMALLGSVLATSPTEGSTIAGAGSRGPSAVGLTSSLAVSAYVPPIHHVFIINIENKGYDETWGPNSQAPYLARTLRSKGVLLNSYYGTAHNSQPNYVAQISGQGPNPQMQGDCQIYSSFVQTGTVPPQQAVGDGCVFPATVDNLPGQLDTAGLSWKGYMEGMHRPCEHPQLDTVDPTQKATATNEYATRHNPFMYFASITQTHAAECRSNVVPLRNLTSDLGSVASTANYTYITPDLCHDGHDSPCANGQQGGLASVNTFMKRWVPRILNSPAYQQDGMLVITADESDGPQSDSSACCGEGPGPNSPQPGISGPGGGRVGALILSRWTTPNTWSTTPYNHYSLLASVEDIFGLTYLGYASQAGLPRFGLDVYNNGWNR